MMKKHYRYILYLFCILIASSTGRIVAQSQILLKGTILSQITHEPVEFANILIKNTSTGTITNQKGNFEITIDSRKHLKLIISHINFHKKEVVINDSLISLGIKVFLESKSKQLSDVIVSANLYEQPMNTLTKSASLITNRQIVDNMNSNMTDMLASIPGFTQVWEYHSPIILRGLNSNRIIIMKDGNRRIGTFPGGYFGQDMNIYDTKKVEIIKGPGSVIYGSGAISGIINVISNDPFGKDVSNVKLLSTYGSNNNEFLEMVKVCYKKEKFGFSINGKFRKTDNMVYGNGETAYNSNVEDRDVSFNTGYKFSEKHQILFNVNYHYGDWGKPRGFNGPTKQFTKIRNEEENIHTNISYTYSPKTFVEIVKLNLYYDNGKRDYFQYKYSTVSGDVSSLNLVHYKDNYGGGRLFAILNISENNKLTTGIDAYLFRLDNPTDIIDYYGNTEGQIKGYKNAGQQNIGSFISDEWQLGSKFRLVTGIRFDAATVTEGETSENSDRSGSRTAFSGNVGLVYSPYKNTHFSLNTGRAFRMATTEELFTKTISCKGVKIGNPDLQPEYSWNFDLGFRGLANNQKIKYDISLFYNKLSDFINEAPDTSNSDVDFTYINTDAELMGGELSASYRFDNVFLSSNTLHVGLGAAYVYGSDLSDNNKSEPLFGMPPFKLNGNLSYRGLLSKKWITGYNIKFGVEYAANQNRIASVPEGTEGGPWGYISSESHTVFNFATGLNFNSLPGYPKLRVIVKNIFDTNYQPFGSYIPAMGRNLKLSLSFTF